MRRSLPGLAVAAVSSGLTYRAARNALDVEAEPIHIEKSVTILSPRDEIYRFWRDFENLPRFMEHLASVMNTAPDGRRSHWVARAPLDSAVSWEAEIVEDRENELIAWRSVPGSTVENHGSVRFNDAPGGRGTEIHVALDYLPPGGGAGAAFARLFGESPLQQMEDDLRRLKQLLEAGVVPTVDGQPSGPRTGLGRIAVEDRMRAVKRLIEASRPGNDRVSA
jgi:uncharacterized membrane protein